MANDLAAHLRPERSFQGLILALQRYWADQGCVVLQPYDMEVGAGTFHTATFLRAIGPEPWSAAYVQPSRRPTDGRYGENPFRLQHYYQYQVVIKPSPLEILDLYLGSLGALGLDPLVHDVRFVEDNWESPTLGAWGIGWQVMFDGMEISQFTYFQQAGGLEDLQMARGGLPGVLEHRGDRSGGHLAAGEEDGEQHAPPRSTRRVPRAGPFGSRDGECA